MKTNRVNVVAEIGINHRGSLTEAFKLIDQASLAKCWGMKFQYRYLETFYKSTNEIGDGIIFEELERVDLSLDQFIEMAEYARAAGLKVGVSFFRLEDFEKFEPASTYFDFYKVPSAECTNLPLIHRLLETDKLVLISTGGHSEAQISEALLPLISNKNLVVFHCIANYPASLGCQGLNFIGRLKSMGFEQVGYSSHDQDIEVCLISLSLGISWLERHITTDVQGSGLDDSSSSEVADFLLLNKFIENLDGLLGSGDKVINQGEILNMQNLGTGLYVKSDFPAGSVLTLNDLDIKAPRKGLSVGEFLHSFSGVGTKIDAIQGASLEIRYYEEPTVFQSEKLFKFAKEQKVGIPVRLHDFESFKGMISTGVFEFHLSYQESMGKDFETVVALLDGSDDISIHLPDYLPGNRIIDPVSDNIDTRRDSRDLISNISIFSQMIEQKIGKPVPVVGSFSETNDRTKTKILDDLYTFIGEVEGSIRILPQWLPVFAWYFGGTVQLNLFNSRDDIDYIVKNNQVVCLDVCHLALSANYHGQSWQSWYKLLSQHSPHLHLADASGVDGEGLPLGTGEIGDFSIFMDCEGMKVIEVWQGHFNNGEGFMKALHHLSA